ncbi:tol-pal system protein YbgF [Nitrospirillum amazonense]|uniref:Cell division coordinator CpoB n=1 Tax=Nitrospirillum amazonense TaxID=28077 RepID=A0A560JQW7_9PROT|nr:tol-pal system protein YbgF [Nitrospirillum amazonense]MDG3441972.1 tol-pal system protein YbgF [Nitrospirillum amazonense]TWB73531.1 tol-pal system protein YbgF [Nitrospirillum amazonense]
MTPSLSSPTLSPSHNRGGRRWWQGASRWMALCSMAALVAVPLLTPAPAGAQSRDMQDLLNRLSRLETDVQTLSRDVYRNGVKPSGPMTGTPGGGGSSAAAEIEVLKLQMETQTQQQTGKYEELAYQVSQIKERLDKLSADIDLRLQKLEDKAGIGLGASTGGGDAGTPPSSDLKGGGKPPLPGTDTGPVPPPGGAKGGAPATAPADSGGTLPAGPAQDQYDYAFNLLRQGDAPNAEKAFTQFLKQNPDSPLASNAQYWLGETFYMRGNYKSAAVAFGDGYKKYPKSNKGADYLLKLALSLDGLGDKASACVVLKQLDADKDAAPTLKRRGEDQKNRLGCK